MLTHRKSGGRESIFISENHIYFFLNGLGHPLILSPVVQFPQESFTLSLKLSPPASSVWVLLLNLVGKQQGKVIKTNLSCHLLRQQYEPLPFSYKYFQSCKQAYRLCNHWRVNKKVQNMTKSSRSCFLSDVPDLLWRWLVALAWSLIFILCPL